jgi:hypothetical protein
MRWLFPLLFASLFAPWLLTGCTGKKAADNESGPRLAAPPMPNKQTDKPQMNMPPVPPPPPPKQ